MSDVKPKGKKSYWRFRVISAGKKVNTFVRHSVSYNLCKGAAIYMQWRAPNSQSTRIMLKLEITFGAETWCTSGTVSYRKM